MKKAVFVSPDGRAHGRWLEAFPDAIIVSSLAAGLEQLSPGAVLWSFNQPMGTLQAKLAGSSDARCVVLSLLPEREESLQAFAAGAQGYCHALATPGLLRDIAIVVGHGGLWVGRELVGETLKTAHKQGIIQSNGAAWGELTEREREVGHWIAEGASNREIAEQLGISPRTVKAHLAAMFDKLNVRDRLQLAVRLSRGGL